jgi:putative membrane protein
MTRLLLGETLAAVNAGLNASCAVLLVLGRLAIGARRVRTHRALMVAAFGCSCVFLASYVARMALTGPHRDAHRGWLHTAYYILLGTHLVTAIAVVPLAVATLAMGLTGRTQAHRRIARRALPVWLYVSTTGVLVYVVLYHVP